MFSNNQVLEISGDLNRKEDLRNALEFALKKYGAYAYDGFTEKDKPLKCLFQITESGDYCIGWCGYDEEPAEGWKEFQFDFDIDIISLIIEKHLRKFGKKICCCGGIYSEAFLMKNINITTTEVKEPFYGIVVFKPFTCVYTE